jgi:hypothetical protein
MLLNAMFLPSSGYFRYSKIWNFLKKKMDYAVGIDDIKLDC